MILYKEVNGKKIEMSPEEEEQVRAGWQEWEDGKTEREWQGIREERDRLLQESDWMVLPDSPLSDTKRDEMKKYRQLLRDIPQRYDSPEKVIWPDKPKI